MKSPYSIDEQETTINMFPAVVSKTAEIYTCIPNMVEKIRKLAKEYPESVAILDTGEDPFDISGYVRATVPREWVKIQPKRKCNMTPEQKQALVDRMNAGKAKKEENQT